MSRDHLKMPTHGFTRAGHAVHATTMDHMPVETRKQRFDKSFALLITKTVGSMNCAYAFAVLALLSLPAVLSQFGTFAHTFPAWMIKASVISLIAWIAQTFLQLVLLSVIMVGQSVQSAAADVRASKTFEDTERIVDALRVDTEGGIKILNDKLDALLKGDGHES